jgi:two-component system, OmpR family, response regulator BaeR
MPRHVLVVEDDHSFSEVICEHLAEHGFLCTTTGDVEEARLVLGRFEIDLVIADLMLPGAASGAKIAREARLKGIPALIVTGHAELIEDDEIRVLQKPLRLSHLLGAVEELLADRPARIDSQ